MTVVAEGTEGRADLELMVGKRRALQSLSTSDHLFAIIAVDHIRAMATVIHEGDPAMVTPEVLSTFKVHLVESLADLASGVLIDPVLGLEPMISSNAMPGDTGLMIGVEDGDYASLDDKPRMFEGWDVARAAKSGANAVKCSFLYDPFSESGAADDFVRELVAACSESGLPLFAEPLAPESLHMDRRLVVVETARRIGALGVDVLKLQFPLVGSSDGSEWRDACREVTEASPRPWTLLSGGADYETFAMQLQVACDAGASGYVAGRSVWNDLVEHGLPFDSDLLGEARQRFQQLADITSDVGTPWTEWFESVSARRTTEYRRPGYEE